MRFIPLLVVAFLCGCGFVYKIDVQQGNYVTQDLVARLKVGMTKTEVRTLLGTPLLVDAFHANRWDYYFSNLKAGKTGNRSRLSVDFKDDRVVAWTGDAQPALPPPVGATQPTAPR